MRIRCRPDDSRQTSYSNALTIATFARSRSKRSNLVFATGHEMKNSDDSENFLFVCSNPRGELVGRLLLFAFRFPARRPAVTCIGVHDQKTVRKRFPRFTCDRYSTPIRIVITPDGWTGRPRPRFIPKHAVGRN